MDNNFDKTENTEETKAPEIDSSDLNDSTNESEAIPEKGKDEVLIPSSCEEPADTCDSTEDTTTTPNQLPYSNDCIGDTIIVPKISFDDETVEQLVENREPQKKQTIAKKKKKKKNHYALKTLIILLGFVLVFVISFFVARTLFTLDDTKTASENQTATDITEKTTEDSNPDDKVIQIQSPDDSEDGDSQAEPIEVDDDEDVSNKTNGNSSNTNNNNNSSNTSNRNNSTNQSNNSNKNTAPDEDKKDDGEVILPGNPSDDEESTGSAGIELE